MLGGENSFGLGGYFDTRSTGCCRWSPILKRRRDTLLAVVPVIDRSGSMGGEKIEMVKRAAEATLRLLSARDYGGVVAFDSGAHWVSRSKAPQAAPR